MQGIERLLFLKLYKCMKFLFKLTRGLYVYVLRAEKKRKDFQSFFPLACFQVTIEGTIRVWEKKILSLSKSECVNYVFKVSKFNFNSLARKVHFFPSLLWRVRKKGKKKKERDALIIINLIYRFFFVS